MLTTTDFGKGVRFLHDGQPYTIVDMTTQSPSARGASTIVKVKARNLLTGKLNAYSFKSGTKFEEPDLHYTSVQYLYTEGDSAVFMDGESYEQFNITHETIGNGAKYLTEELKIKAMYYNGNPVNVELPAHVALKVTTVEPGTKGNTASSTVLTRAELENGVEVRVPLNIKEGDKILVDPNDDSFYGRA